MTTLLDAMEVTGRARTHVRQAWQPRFAARPEIHAGHVLNTD
jgi:hypothetical protein